MQRKNKKHSLKSINSLKPQHYTQICGCINNHKNIVDNIKVWYQNDVCWQHRHSSLSKYYAPKINFKWPHTQNQLWGLFKKIVVRHKLSTTDAHHILLLFNIVSCNWYALVAAFVQRMDSVLERLLFVVFQPANCRTLSVNVHLRKCSFRLEVTLC